MVALAVQVLAGAVVAVAVALHVADGGHGVGGRAHGVRVAEAVLKLDLVLVPVPPQDRLHLCPGTKQTHINTGGQLRGLRSLMCEGHSNGVSANQAVRLQNPGQGGVPTYMPFSP